MADKAALFGINDYKFKNIPALHGCVNDVENMKSLLIGTFGFDGGNVHTFVNAKATKAEVLRQMKWLFRDVAEGDRLVFHLSSHGSNVADRDGDEPDGQDEIFCLYDMDFDDPGSYLVDDELRDWTAALPSGAQLLVVLDTCHSGTGTRLVLRSDAEGVEHPVRIDDATTLKRSINALGSGQRALDQAAASLQPDHPEVVRVRYVEPPPAVKAEIAAARRRASRSRSRGFVRAPLNHVLLAACRDDQTAADASIGGQSSGAFTYYLCRALQSEGPGVLRQALIDQVGRALIDGQFSQVPQLEAQQPDVPIFTGSGSQPASTAGSPSFAAPAQAKATGAAADPWGLLAKIVGDGESLDAAARGHALDVLSKIVGAAPGAPGAGRGLAGRVLVPVHGICRHVAGYSNPWWDSLRPYTTAFGAGALGDTRREVLWSDLVNQRGLAHRGFRDLRDAEAVEQADFAAKVRGVLEERTAAEGLEDAPTPSAARDLFARDLGGERGLSIPGFNCIDDFAVYMFNDSTRAEVIARFTAVVRPLLEAGVEVDVLSHSWGTVVAYEALRELESSFTTQLIRNFFTVGSALSLFPVKSRLRPANKDGRKPRIVRRWINLDAHGDPVGGELKGKPFQVDEEHLDLDNMGCGFLAPSCAHGSYFQSGNAAVNRDIFARNINAV
jgi:hypothetical protein